MCLVLAISVIGTMLRDILEQVAPLSSKVAILVTGISVASILANDIFHQNIHTFPQEYVVDISATGISVFLISVTIISVLRMMLAHLLLPNRRLNHPYKLLVSVEMGHRIIRSLSEFQNVYSGTTKRLLPSWQHSYNLAYFTNRAYCE